MCPADPFPAVRTTVEIAALETENKDLRERLESAEQARTARLAA
jgi:hypothetical protein